MGSSATRAAGACICICGHALWAEQTQRPACQAPATCTGRRQRSWRWRRSGSPATEPSGPVTKLDPLDHLQPIPAAHWTHGGLDGVKFPPCWLPDPAGDPHNFFIVRFIHIRLVLWDKHHQAHPVAERKSRIHSNGPIQRTKIHSPSPQFYVKLCLLLAERKSRIQSNGPIQRTKTHSPSCT